MSSNSEKVQLQNEFPLFVPNLNSTVWEGYLSLENPQLKIKVCTPHYPELKDFSLECSPLIKNCIMPELKTLKGCNSLKGLIYSIIHLIKIKSSSVNFSDSLWDSKTIKFNHELLCELEAVINKEDIVSIGDDFRTVKVKYCDSEGYHNPLKFQIPVDYPKGYITILDADLPSEVLSSLSKISSIKSLYTSFIENVESLIPFWNACKALEAKTWVVDPPNPQRRDTFRRIILNDHLSVLITFNPSKMSECPDLKFIGSLKAVAEARATYVSNIDMIGWDEDLDIAENIMQLLDIPKLPTKNIPTTENSVSENDCFICYSYVLDNEEPPSRWCGNPKCASWYHYSCLLQWLESVVTSTRMYDHICGTCPYCDEKILCPLKDQEK